MTLKNLLNLMFLIKRKESTKMEITFTVPGKPRGKARPRAVRKNGGVYMYTPPKTQAYEASVKEAFQEEAYKQHLLKNFPLEDEQAVFVKITAAYKIPTMAAKSKKLKMLCGKLLPTTKPDCDNIAKIICDALNGVAYRDDKQVVWLTVSKIYTYGEPYVRVRLMQALTEQEKADGAIN